MKLLPFLFILFQVIASFAQSLPEDERFLESLKKKATAQEGLLAGRSALLYSSDYTESDLMEIQKGFQQTGIDAVTYIESERVMAGADLKNAYRIRFVKRDIKFIIFARKQKGDFQLCFLTLNTKNNWTRSGQSAWFVSAPTLKELMTSVYRNLVSTQKRENFLVNDFPEEEPLQNLFGNARNEELLPSLRSAKIAIPRVEDRSADAALLQFLQENLSAKYEIVEDTTPVKELVQKNFRYQFRFVHCSGSLAKEVLGYDRSKSESALVSTTFPAGVMQLKTIDSKSLIFKFYIKDLEDGYLYLGTKWDADVKWQDAFKNHIEAYRTTGRVN